VKKMFGKKKTEAPSPNAHILVITGELNTDYQIIDSVFAMDSNTEGFFSLGANPGKAFNGVREQLRVSAIELGGDAVINCMFEYRVAVADGLISKKQVMEIFAYGTVVKRL
tara:strand:+ start:795 stop:1127 length:333 start_codon:yes stop_codon:yes gene_type:complete